MDAKFYQCPNLGMQHDCIKILTKTLLKHYRFKIPSRYDDDQPPTQSGNADSGQGASQQLQHHQQYLGDSSGGLPELPDVELDEPLPGNSHCKYTYNIPGACCLIDHRFQLWLKSNR